MKFVAQITDWFRGFFDKKLWSSSSYGRKTTANECVSEDTALNYSAVWCATQVRCGTAAALPFPLYSGDDTGTRVKERDHPVYKLLNQRANPEMTAYNFRSIMWQWQVNWGNAYAEIEREGNVAGGKIVALWPIHPERVTVMRNPENDELFYSVKNGIGEESDDLPAWKIFHIASILTYDGIVGHGVIAHARESIGAGIAAEKYGANWFGGAAVPRVVVEVPRAWTDESRKTFRDEWEELYTGADGRRVAVIDAGAVVKPLSLSAEDSQFLGTRQFGIEEIARWYNVPPHMLQHLLQATFNNIEELGINFVQYSLVPWLTVWEQEVWKKLLTEDEQKTLFAEHNVDALLRGNHAARAEFYTTMIGANIMTRNEARRLENLDPVEGGDTFLVQGAMVPLDSEGRPESKFVTPSADATAPNPDQQQTPPPQDGKMSQNGANSAAIKAVACRLGRVLKHDLSRLLTKETKTVANLARKPDQFVSSIDEFYQSHAVTMTEATGETLGALSVCGLDVAPEVFVATWVREGKTAILEAAGTATTVDLGIAVQRVLDSKIWTERPQIAVENVQHATIDV